MKKIQNIIKSACAICWLITACSKYDTNGLNMVRSEDGVGIEVNNKLAIAQLCNDCESLHKAVLNGHEDCVKALIEVGVDADGCDYYGNTALILAAIHGRISFISELIEAGANINAHNQDGYTALMLAARNGYAFCVSTLIEAGANINARDQYGNTALVWAESNENIACAMALIEAGAV